MPYFLLLYDVVDDYPHAREPHRAEHLDLARTAHGKGEIVMAGAFGDPPTGAALVFRADDRGVVEEFAQRDPYVRSGVVTRWRVLPWHVVVGGVERV